MHGSWWGSRLAGRGEAALHWKRACWGLCFPALRQKEGAERGTVLLSYVRRGLISAVTCDTSQDPRDDSYIQFS